MVLRKSIRNECAYNLQRAIITTEGRESVVDLTEMRIEMSEKEIVLILKDLFSDYGAHVGLTT